MGAWACCCRYRSKMHGILQKCAAFSEQHFCYLIRLTVYSELGCGLEEDVTVAKHTHAAGPVVYGTAQIWVWIYKGIVVPRKYHPTAKQVQNLGAKNLCKPSWRPLWSLESSFLLGKCQTSLQSCYFLRHGLSC